MVLWTRLAPDPLNGGGMPRERVRVDWIVAEDEGLRRGVRRGTVVASPELAHSVHVEVNGLDPNREYFYRFSVRDEESPVGRTRTAPRRNDGVELLAFAPCQKWDDGFYSAYRCLAEDDLDLVLHLGDYVYEYGIGPTPASPGSSPGTTTRWRTTTPDSSRGTTTPGRPSPRRKKGQSAALQMRSASCWSPVVLRFRGGLTPGER